MFSEPYLKAYFGMAFPSGDDSSIYGPARRDALMVLKDAADRSWDQDMQTEEVRAALDFLKEGVARDAPFERFWQTLHHPDLWARRRLALAELRVIVRAVPTFAANSRRTDF